MGIADLIAAFTGGRQQAPAAQTVTQALLAQRLAQQGQDRQQAAFQANMPQSPTGQTMTATPPTRVNTIQSLIEEGLGKIGLDPRLAAGTASKAAGVASLTPLATMDQVDAGDYGGALESMVGGPAAKLEGAGIRAFHGSPHSFDKFSLDKIGTGEGAQAFGHGLYFAENEAVARDYRDVLSAKTSGLRFDGAHLPSAMAMNKDPVADMAFNAVTSTGGNVDEAIAALNEMGEQVPADWLRANAAKFKGGPGHMYEVDINADPEAFLDWDKPLSNEKALEILDKAYDNSPDAADLYRAIKSGKKSNVLGSTVYNAVGNPFEGWAGAAASLKEQGIPGIKYLDAGSRGAGDGSRNYVVFDDTLVNIVKKYGIVAAVGGGLISQQMADQMKAQGDI